MAIGRDRRPGLARAGRAAVAGGGAGACRYLGTPYTLDYDMMILASPSPSLSRTASRPASRRGRRRPWPCYGSCRWLRAVLRRCPLVPIGVLIIILALAVTLHRVANEAAAAALPART